MQSTVIEIILKYKTRKKKEVKYKKKKLYSYCSCFGSQELRHRSKYKKKTLLFTNTMWDIISYVYIHTQ